MAGPHCKIPASTSVYDVCHTVSRHSLPCSAVQAANATARARGQVKVSAVQRSEGQSPAQALASIAVAAAVALSTAAPAMAADLALGKQVFEGESGCAFGAVWCRALLACDSAHTRGLAAAAQCTAVRRSVTSTCQQCTHSQLACAACRCPVLCARRQLRCLPRWG
jgi:hypothetical protein